MRSSLLERWWQWRNGECSGGSYSFPGRCSDRPLNVRNAEECGHFFVEESAAGFVGLDPFSVDDELWDGALADVGLDGVGGTGDGLDVDLVVGEIVLLEEAFSLAAVAAPAGGVKGDVHPSIFADPIEISEIFGLD
jgi:hypothetical protein